MPAAPSSTPRLLESLESLRSEESAAMAAEDWNGLDTIFDRELALIGRLARQGDRFNPQVIARAEGVRDRYRQLAQILAQRHSVMAQEMHRVRQARRHTFAVQKAYRAS